jgi:hypothetical protein
MNIINEKVTDTVKTTVQTSVKKAVPYAAIIIFLGALLFSFCKYMFNRPGDRRVFYFKSYDNNKTCTEIRYEPHKPVQGREQLFVDELLLGPMTNRFRPLFTRGTKTEFCFLRGSTLYVGLSKEALQISADSADIGSGVKLLKKNVLKNFTYINAVEMYIDGKSVAVAK